MSGVKATVTLNLSGLDDLKKAIGKRYYTKVGILGATPHQQPVNQISKRGKVTRKAGTEASGITNPELGATMELGTADGKIPSRSWLRFPLEYKMRDMVKFLQSKPMQAELARGNLKQFMKLWGIKAEEIIQSAFETAGFGTWAPNAPSTIADKGSSAPLIDTSQLRRAIDSKVVDKSA